MIISFKYISPGIVAWALCLSGLAQNTTHQSIWNKLIVTEENSSPPEQKIVQVLRLRKQFEDSHLVEDSVYARILHRIGLYEYWLNNNIATNASIDNTVRAIRINAAAQKGSCESFAVNSYINLAFYYKSLLMNDRAINYFDSTIQIAKKFPEKEIFIIRSRIEKGLLLFQKGDYQKNIEENSIGLTEAKKAHIDSLVLGFFNQRAQTFLYQDQLLQSDADADSAIYYANKLNDVFELAQAYKTKAAIYSEMKKHTNAITFYETAIKLRIKTGIYSQVADDYTDFGNFFLNHLHDYPKAKACYLQTINYAIKGNNNERLSKANVGLGLASFYSHNYSDAEYYYSRAIEDLKLNPGNNFLQNPTAKQLKLIGNKELILVILGNKTELLVNQYKENHDEKYLSACLKTALLSDSIITQTRYEQFGEQSKLYWRNRTKEFFTNALEASYLAHNDSLAFYFMEKSRAVLLNDKLNELGANVYLSPADASKEQNLRIRIITQQEKLNELTTGNKAYNDLQTELFQTKDERDKFVKSLEQKYSAYYQYKYADEMPALRTLQQYLANNRQEFVHYFMGDTVAYILSITATSAKMVRLSQRDLPYESITRFLQFCSDNQRLNSDYTTFASLSHRLYAILFQPLQLPKGRVVICPDNFMLPFEALCYDTEGRQFLINDYVFSYVYSARFLLKQFNPPKAEGNFIGFAPVSFQPYLKLNELKQSAIALKDAAGYYDHTELFTNTAANRKIFIQKIAGYSIVNVFSHARADTSGVEPLLYMQDSVIRLSELQRLNDPATQLVVLSACQTNVGRNATGEGIYSLARGFAAAGIPAISATLWKADEQTIYAVSEKFHEFLSKGMNKDEALQKAKLYFMQNGSSERLLPYYWANMVLIGNAQPIIASKTVSFVWWPAAAIILLIIIVAMLKRKQK